jgi:lactate dehydrogenase-like 2-hydroxyacid dehydrogenase
LTPETRGLLGHAELGLLHPGAVVINDARGPILDLDALLAHLKSGHIAAAGLDVLSVEPPVEPVPELLRLYRARVSWLEGRLVVTHTPPGLRRSPRPTRDANRPRRCALRC